MSRRHVFFFFLDGVGLGRCDPASNPFSAARMPTLAALLGERWFLHRAGPRVTDRASLVPTDACLGVPGRPQSATGQAALLTGRNVPAEIGGHYGPKPTRDIAAILSNGNLFSVVQSMGGAAAFLNPYPPRFFDSVNRGVRLLSAIPLAATAAGLPLMNYDDLVSGRAVSPDFTGQGWREQLGFHETPLLSLSEAGARLTRLAQKHDLTFFEHWPSDLVGHRQAYEQAVEILERLDTVLAGMLQVWDWDHGLILITSDHGNIEDLAVRTHTLNPVPTILIGREHARLATMVSDLTDVAPLVKAYLTD